MKKVLIYLIIFVTLCAASGYGIDHLVYHEIDHQSPYYLSFASIGAISLESRLDCWAKLNRKLSQEELQAQAKEVLNNLGMPWDDEKAIPNSKNNDHALAYTVQSGHLTYSFSAETDSDKNESYFLLSVISRDKSSDLSSLEERLRQGNLNWRYYYLYTGKLDHYADQESRRQLLEVMLENMDSHSDEVYEDQYMTSISAYTPLFNNSVKVQDKKYNLQIAARSVIGEQEAFIYIGQPLIIGDY